MSSKLKAQSSKLRAQSPLQARVISRATMWPSSSLVWASVPVATATASTSLERTRSTLSFGIIGRVSRIVAFFTLLGIAAGLLITVSSVLATRRARIREAVYYRILGGKSGFVLRVFTLEGALVGLGSGTLALLFAQGMTWGIAVFQLDIGYRPYWTLSALSVAAVAALTVITSLGVSGRILRRRPAEFLREREG